MAGTGALDGNARGHAAPRADSLHNNKNNNNNNKKKKKNNNNNNNNSNRSNHININNSNNNSINRRSAIRVRGDASDAALRPGVLNGIVRLPGATNGVNTNSQIELYGKDWHFVVLKTISLKYVFLND